MGFEPTNGGFADQSWISILMVRLAFTLALPSAFGHYLGLIVPKLFPSPRLHPYSETVFDGHTCSFDLQSVPIPAVSFQGCSPFVG